MSVCTWISFSSRSSLVVVAWPFSGSSTPQDKRISFVALDPEIIYRLIYDLFYHDRSQPCVQRAGQFYTEFINSLASEKSGSDRHMAGYSAKLLSFFIDDPSKAKCSKRSINSGSVS